MSRSDLNQKPAKHPFVTGAITALSPPGLVLIVTFFAFGALVSSLDLPFELALGMTIFMFAIPGQVVLVDELARGGSLITAAIATTFSAIRLMPLAFSMMPILRTDNTPKWKEILISHFIAVTVWTQSMLSLPHIEPKHRADHCLGFCLALLVLTITATIIGFNFAHHLPKYLASASLMVTPIYFFLSLFKTASNKTDQLAFFMGTIIAIPMVLYTPEIALIGAGLIAGTFAYYVQSAKQKKSETESEAGNKSQTYGDQE